MAAVVRDELGRVVGGALNPGGRPKGVVEVMRLAREHTVEAIEALVDVMRSEDPKAASARVAAANALLDRGWGKVAAAAVDEGDELDASPLGALTPEQVRALAAAKLSREH